MAITKVSYSMIDGAPINVLDFGAVGDGVTDDSAAFIAARAAANGNLIYAPARTYKLNQAITGSTDLILEGDGPSTILDFTGTVTDGNYALDAIGTATQIQELSGTQTVGTNTVTFASAPSLAVGDVFVIFNPTNSSWSAFRSNYFAGEWCEVESVVGNVVTVRNQLYDTYAAADVDVYKITGPKVVLRNFDIRGTTVTGLIKTTLCIEPLIENIKASHANDSVVYFDRCFKPTVTNPDMNNVGDLGDDYGIVVGNSQHVKVLGGNIYARRHAITTGGNAEVCAVPVRDARFIGCTLKNDINSGTYAADFHGNTEDSSYIDCTIYGGASWQGKDVEYVNCTITADVGGRVIYSAEIKGGRFDLRNCNLTTYVNPQSGGRGVIDIGGNNNAITADTVLPCNFSIVDCNFYGRNLTSITSFVLMRNAGTTSAINFNVNNVTANVNSLNAILRTSLDSGTAASSFIVVDNIINFPSGTLLHSAVGSNYLNFPHRLQKQTGTQTLTATSGTSVTVDSIRNFKYVYPRTPSAQTTSVGTIVGNRLAMASFYDLTSSTYRLQINSPDATNWSATADRVVNWIASIDEV